MSDPLRFLSRWSRLKRQAATAARPDAPPETPASTADTRVAPTAASAPESLAAAAPLPGPDAIAQLGFDSDFSAYMQAEVGEGLRRQAMKKLFADPHFNVMDGLDIYIDDYSISDPIPADMLAGLNQMQRLFPEPAPAAAEAGEAITAAPTEPATRGDRSAVTDGTNCDIPEHQGQNAPEEGKTADKGADFR